MDRRCRHAQPVPDGLTGDAAAVRFAKGLRPTHEMTDAPLRVMHQRPHNKGIVASRGESRCRIGRQDRDLARRRSGTSARPKGRGATSQVD